MQIVINDANILIDLAKLELLEKFSQLNFELYSTDFVIEELNSDQRLLVDDLIYNNKLTVIETESYSDFIDISTLLENSTGLSFEDCSVWYYSKKMNGILLTGDGKLRKQARNDNVEVKGIIYIFDQLIVQSLIDYATAVTKMKELLQLNVRLPKNEMNKRLQDWENKKH